MSFIRIFQQAGRIVHRLRYVRFQYTFGFTGTIFLNSGHVTALPFGEGLNTYLQYGNSVLENGAITDGDLQSLFGGMSSFGTFGDYVEYGGPSFPVCYIAFNRNPGVWTSIDLGAPVPGPIIGVGLSSALMAIAGFIRWRRRRHAIAV
jgi:hypothetical protein